MFKHECATLARSVVRWSCGVLVVAGLAGCLESPIIMVPAEGYVKINGEPAENIMVQFLPDMASGSNCPTSSAISDSEGWFKLTTVDGRDGVVEGTCRVTLVDLDEERGSQDAPSDGTSPKQRLPPKYNIPSPNGLSANVKEGGEPIVIDVRG